MNGVVISRVSFSLFLFLFLHRYIVALFLYFKNTVRYLLIYVLYLFMLCCDIKGHNVNKIRYFFKDVPDKLGGKCVGTKSFSHHDDTKTSFFTFYLKGRFLLISFR